VEENRMTLPHLKGSAVKEGERSDSLEEVRDVYPLREGRTPPGGHIQSILRDPSWPQALPL
jgi:hypothetical protein